MITILVDYKLLEYLKILRDFFPTALKKDSELKGKKYKGFRWYHYLSIYIIGPPVFAFKKTVVGNCTFKLNEEGISRKSKIGEKNNTLE